MPERIQRRQDAAAALMPGCRVRLTDLARENGAGGRKQDRIGTLVGRRGYRFMWVIWDGLRNPQSYNTAFIERAPDDDPLPEALAARFVHIEQDDA